MRLVETSSAVVGAVVEAPPSTNSILMNEKFKKYTEDDEKSPEDKKQARMAMNKHLVGQFGQTKGKRVYEQADRMKVEASKLTDKLSKVAMAVSEEAVALPTDIQAASSAEKLIPPMNRDAGLVQDVYDVNDIISAAELEVLGEAADELVQDYDTDDKVQTAVESKRFSPIFGKHLERLRRDRKSLAVAVYMEAIVQFCNMRASWFSKGPRGMPQSHIPMIVKQKLFREFTTDQNTISPETRDKAMCYVIVLALLTNSFNVEFSEVSSSLRVKADQ